ncbi:hypothetical protein H920_06150 [Fukomys damarensis]|uniref:Uncharacterized protein n=1 Tax=Fukomys damarensis TaxID=885580 RepID=A0A091EB05_FUKDA|nr:hypothetical protein H920_06150 [Fukomys damarensis]
MNRAELRTLWPSLFPGERIQGKPAISEDFRFRVPQSVSNAPQVQTDRALGTATALPSHSGSGLDTRISALCRVPACSSTASFPDAPRSTPVKTESRLGVRARPLAAPPSSALVPDKSRLFPRRFHSL